MENSLDEDTTVHWHGAHVPAKMDGGPHQQVAAGSTWTAEFPIQQQAATLWYHPHLIPTTAEQVYRGLAGMFIIEDSNSDSLPIPQEYGRNDIPLILQERRFRRDGRFTYGPSQPDIMHGYAGNAILANGALKPYLEVGREVLRLRLLNGSNSSVLRIRLEDQRPFLQIASDGGLLENPVEMTAVVLSPGERAELLVNFTRFAAGETLNLTADTNAGSAYQAVQFVVRESAAEGRRDAPVRSYPATSLRLNSIDPILAAEAGWKDTVLLWPGDVVRIIKRFEDYTGIYMYHCHLLEHEDAGMMGQFEVIQSD